MHLLILAHIFSDLYNIKIMSARNRKNSASPGKIYEKRSFNTDPYKLPNIYSKKPASNISPYECLYKICRQLINYFLGIFEEIISIKNEINDYLSVRMEFFKDNVNIQHLNEELRMHKFSFIKNESIILTSFDLLFVSTTTMVEKLFSLHLENPSILLFNGEDPKSLIKSSVHSHYLIAVIWASVDKIPDEIDTKPIWAGIEKS